jgi:DNA-directed RNA polymerase specialized sigma24 family protein
MNRDDFRRTEREGAEELELEEEATALLREAGAFRRGRGIRSPRSEREARARTAAWEEWRSGETQVDVPLDLRRELDAVAEAVGLNTPERQVLELARGEERSLREIAALLGWTVYRVRLHLNRALRKCGRRGEELPRSARGLFWEEVRQKQASIYRPPYRSRRAARRGGP